MKKPKRISDVLLGTGYLALIVGVIIGTVMTYNKAFASSVDVSLHTGVIGNALQQGSDVKLHGVPVGEVSNITPQKSGAVVELALDTDAADTIPSNAVARLLPKTLFGERYVALSDSGDSTEMGLSDGDEIHQDTSDEAVELEEVFDELLPVLQSIQPDKLAAMLGELSTTLRGEGKKIGDAMEVWDDYLKKLNPHVPAMTKDLERLADVADTYNEALPDLLSALDTMTTTSQTMVDREADLRTVYASVIGSSDTTRGWVAANQQTIEVLSSSSRDALAAVRPYAEQFPCLFEATNKFIPQMDKNLGKNTGEPGIHVRLNVVESRGKYLAGKDTPAYKTGGKPRCPYVTGNSSRPGTKPAAASQKSPSEPTTSAAGETPDAIPAPPADIPHVQAAEGLGPANSPAENDMIAELIAPTIGEAPSDFPDWSSVLIGPVLRGTQVTLE